MKHPILLILLASCILFSTCKEKKFSMFWNMRDKLISFHKMINAILLVALCVTSCSTAQDVLLDGDMRRSELVSLDRREQDRVYSNLSPEAKYRLWKYKMEDNLGLPYLSHRDKAPIRQFYRKMKPALWIRPFVSASDSLFLADFSEKISRAGWSEEKRYLLFETYLTIGELNAGNYLESRNVKLFTSYTSEELLRFRRFIVEHVKRDLSGSYIISTPRSEAKSMGVHRKLYKYLQDALGECSPADTLSSRQIADKVLKGDLGVY